METNKNNNVTFTKFYITLDNFNQTPNPTNYHFKKNHSFSFNTDNLPEKPDKNYEKTYIYKLTELLKPFTLSNYYYIIRKQFPQQFKLFLETKLKEEEDRIKKD